MRLPVFLGEFPHPCISNRSKEKTRHPLVHAFFHQMRTNHKLYPSPAGEGKWMGSSAFTALSAKLALMTPIFRLLPVRSFNHDDNEENFPNRHRSRGPRPGGFSTRAIVGSKAQYALPVFLFCLAPIFCLLCSSTFVRACVCV